MWGCWYSGAGVVGAGGEWVVAEEERRGVGTLEVRSQGRNALQSEGEVSGSASSKRLWKQLATPRNGETRNSHADSRTRGLYTF